MKSALAAVKSYIRWLIVGATLVFVLKTLKDRWQEVAAVQVNGTGWLLVGLLVTLLGHGWSGWVWCWILKAFNQPLGGWRAWRVYLITNIYKYLPGNVGHFGGRIAAVVQAGGSLGVASVSVLLEPLLMAAAALLVALLAQPTGLLPEISGLTWGWQFLGLAVVLLGVHPRFLNGAIALVGRLKGKKTDIRPVILPRYPLGPLLGEIGFLLLRGAGFIFTLRSLMVVPPGQIPHLLSAFSGAWLLGLVVPGAPGGLGVFEAAAIALLQGFPAGPLLGGLAWFRLISILAEAIAAALAWLIHRNLHLKANG